jgi:DNA-binding transcriptional ArsR family regulator
VATKKKQPKPVDEDRILLTDARSIRAIAHPARLKAIDELFQGQVRTSTELAELTGLSASAMSYHLRSLEKWGIVQRVLDGDDGRERPWKAAGKSLGWTNDVGAEIGPFSIIVKQFFDEMAGRMDAWQRVEPTAPAEWRDGSTLTRGFPWFTTQEAVRFNEGVQALLREIGAPTEPEASAGARRHALLFAMVPTTDGFVNE